MRCDAVHQQRRCPLQRRCPPGHEGGPRIEPAVGTASCVLRGVISLITPAADQAGHDREDRPGPLQFREPEARPFLASRALRRTSVMKRVPHNRRWDPSLRSVFCWIATGAAPVAIVTAVRASWHRSDHPSTTGTTGHALSDDALPKRAIGVEPASAPIAAWARQCPSARCHALARPASATVPGLPRALRFSIARGRSRSYPTARSQASAISSIA